MPTDWRSGTQSGERQETVSRGLHSGSHVLLVEGRATCSPSQVKPSTTPSTAPGANACAHSSTGLGAPAEANSLIAAINIGAASHEATTTGTGVMFDERRPMYRLCQSMKRQGHQPAQPLSNRTIALGAVIMFGIGVAAFTVLW